MEADVAPVRGGARVGGVGAERRQRQEGEEDLERPAEDLRADDAQAGLPTGGTTSHIGDSITSEQL